MSRRPSGLEYFPKATRIAVVVLLTMQFLSVLTGHGLYPANPFPMYAADWGGAVPWYYIERSERSPVGVHFSWSDTEGNDALEAVRIGALSSSLDRWHVAKELRRLEGKCAEKIHSVMPAQAREGDYVQSSCASFCAAIPAEIARKGPFTIWSILVQRTEPDAEGVVIDASPVLHCTFKEFPTN